MHRPLLLAVALAGCQASSWPDVDPGPPTLRRLTQAQYENAVRDLFGHDLFVPPDLEPDFRQSGLVTVGAASVAISPRGVERYESAAYAIAEQAMDPWRRGRVLPCTPASTADAACAEATLARLGRRAWRRPLTSEELDTLVAVSMEAAEVLGDFHEGLQFGLAALLQSPDFLMRVELGEAADGARAYTGWETASRLSFLLWNTLPDDALLDAAAAGELDSPEGVEAQALRLLASPRARLGLRAYVSDLLQLEKLDRLHKDATVFVHMTDALPTSAREETLRLFEDVVFDQDADLRDVLTTRDTFVDRTLATLYEVRAPEREGFGRVTLPDDGERLGLLGHASMLAMHAHATSTSPTLRGIFLRETLLCEEMPDPPGNVDTSIPEASSAFPTLRDRVASHLTVPACAACHEPIDLPGLTLERFDGIGRYRTVENGTDIDDSGELDGTTFRGLPGLAAALRDHPNVVPCMVEHVVDNALGRTHVAGEDAVFDALVERFTLQEHRMQPLLLDLVTSPLFLSVGEVEE